MASKLFWCNDFWFTFVSYVVT